MANVTINTQSAIYQQRHAEFLEVVNLLKPYLVEYFKMTKEQQDAWRANDPFLSDVLRVGKAVVDFAEENL